MLWILIFILESKDSKAEEPNFKTQFAEGGKEIPEQQGKMKLFPLLPL